MDKFKSKIFYLKRRFNIDLWAEVIRKKNWKTFQSKRFLVRIEKYVLLGISGPGETNRMLKEDNIDLRAFISKLRKNVRNFRSYDSDFNRLEQKQTEFEHGQYFRKNTKFFKVLKILNLRKKEASFFSKINNNKYNFQFYSNLYDNLFLLTNYLFSKKLTSGKQVINTTTNSSSNFFKNFEIFKYEIYMRRHLPTKLWTHAFYTYYRFKIKKPWAWAASKRQKWWMEKNKISKSLLVYYGFGTKKKFIYLKNNLFKKKIWAKSSSLYLSKLIINILHKTNFFKTFRQVYILIKTTGVLLNNSLVKNPYILCNVGKVLSFPNYTKYFLIKSFFNNLHYDNLIIRNWPSYFEVNLRTLSLVLWREPNVKELKRFEANYINNSLLWF